VRLEEKYRIDDDDDDDDDDDYDSFSFYHAGSTYGS